MSTLAQTTAQSSAAASTSSTSATVKAASMTDMIKVKTAIDGEIEVPANKVVSFVEPLLGYTHLKDFVLYQKEAGPLYWLQSIEDERAAFCLLAPFEAGIDYDIEIGAQDASDLTASSAEEIAVYTVMVLDQDPQKIRTNLRAPILLGKESNIAKQVILANNRLPVQFFVHKFFKAS